MGKYLSIAFSLTLLLFSCNQQKGSQLTLSDYTYDFGVVNQGDICQGEVVLRNTGNATLKIQKIDAGCTCTVAAVSKQEIAPQDTCVLRFSYNTNRKSEAQEDYIFIVANTDSLVHALTINAYVKDAAML